MVKLCRVYRITLAQLEAGEGERVWKHDVPREVLDYDLPDCHIRLVNLDSLAAWLWERGVRA